MNAIILLGAPGSGKGSTAEKIKQMTGYIHISTGDMLREAMKNKTRIGREAESFMKRGALVPDEIIIRLVEERFDSVPDPEEKGGAGGDLDKLYMFDGFPRTIVQAELLEQSMRKRHGKILHVFFLDAPRDVLIKRLSGRRICRKCGANYHVINIPPRETGICDVCGGELYQRSDDQEATIINRLEVYNKRTESLISHYEVQGLLVRINSNQAIEKIVEEIMDVLITVNGYDDYYKKCGRS